TLVGQHFGDTTHARTTDADKMDATNAAHSRYHMDSISDHGSPPDRSRPPCRHCRPRRAHVPPRPTPPGHHDADNSSVHWTGRPAPALAVAATVLPDDQRASAHSPSGGHPPPSATARTGRRRQPLPLPRP